MNPSEKKQDEMISSAFDVSSLHFDFEKWKQDHTDSVLAYQLRIQQKITGNCCSVYAWRKILQSGLTRTAAAAVLLIAIYVIIQQSGSSIDGTSMVFAKMVENMEEMPWVPEPYKEDGLEYVKKLRTGLGLDNPS